MTFQAAATHLRDGGYGDFTLMSGGPYGQADGIQHTNSADYWGFSKPAGVHTTYTESKTM